MKSRTRRACLSGSVQIDARRDVRGRAPLSPWKSAERGSCRRRTSSRELLFEFDRSPYRAFFNLKPLRHAVNGIFDLERAIQNCGGYPFLENDRLAETPGSIYDHRLASAERPPSRDCLVLELKPLQIR